MNSNITIFLKRFLAILYLDGIVTIPFSGDRFQMGMASIEDLLHDKLSQNAFGKLSDLFLKTPVQEKFDLARDMLMTFNGDVVGFSAVDNPYWNNMSIKMNDYLARKILNDYKDDTIDNSLIKQCAITFCDAAEVPRWEEY